MSNFNVEVQKLKEAGYDVQRRERWYCTIDSSKTGQTVLKIAELPGREFIAFNQNEEFLFSKDSILVTVEGKKPIAKSKGKIIWGTETEE